jgi:hypothetical protein
VLELAGKLPPGVARTISHQAAETMLRGLSAAVPA